MNKDSGMSKVVRDVFKEDENSDKFSSKKLMGMIAGFLCFLSYVLDMFTIYKVNLTLFDSMLIFSASMLGASMVKSFGRNGSQYSSNSNNRGDYGYGGGGGGGYGGGYGGGGYGGGYGGGGYGGGVNVNVHQTDSAADGFHNPNYDDSYFDPNESEGGNGEVNENTK